MRFFSAEPQTNTLGLGASCGNPLKPKEKASLRRGFFWFSMFLVYPKSFGTGLF
jgi:hypothetical protein